MKAKSTPSRIPSGRAVTKFPDATRMRAPSMGELGSPIESSASTSVRTEPAASTTASSAALSVTRTPSTKRVSIPRSANRDSI